MSVINSIPLIAAGDDGYQISRSVRLRSSASAYFNRTPSASSRTTWTWSAWVKRGKIAAQQYLFQARIDDSAVDTNKLSFFFNTDDTLNVFSQVTVFRKTSAVFRDPSAWYHIVLVADTTNATANNRFRLYINNVEQTYSTTNNPSLSLNTAVNSANPHFIGSENGATFFDGYLTEINFIDGQALTPSSFGETDAVTGVWKPKKYAGTYGTNGFYLNFSDNSAATAAAIGKDNSGNGNNWTPNNISVTAGTTYDSMLDSPTNFNDGTSYGVGNYAVLNGASNSSASNSFTFSNANLQASASVSSGGRGITSTVEMRAGKWYAEFVVSSWGSSNNADIGILRSDTALYTTSSFALSGCIGSYLSNGYSINQVGGVYNNGTSLASGLTSYTTSDIVQVAYDADNGKLYFGKNNTWLNSSDPSAGTNGFSVTTGYGYLFAFGGTSNTAQTVTVVANFGQRPFTYTPPTGFVALNTQNLPAPTIKKGNQYFDVSLYTGNATARSITGVGFQPDFVWTKSRSAAESHRLYDAVRGATQSLYSNLTNAEATEAQSLTAFNSDGFSLGTGAPNSNAVTYAAWQWKESPSAGFDIVTYTGTGSARTISHSLGVAPRMMIVKSRSTTWNWITGWAALGWGNYINLNSTGAAGAGSTIWNNTAPTSSVFSLGTDNNINQSGQTYVAYLFAEVAGFSKFGSYVGNGSSTDGPFVFTGFRPRYVMIKNTSGVGNWVVVDTARNTNGVGARLYADLSDAEYTGDRYDHLSNGFKIRTTSAESNTSGSTYIYAAFAEVGFKYALGR